MPNPPYAVSKNECEIVIAAGRRLTCLVCGGERFAYREVSMNTAGMSFMGLDWANKTADGAICRTCGFVHTFMGGAVEWRKADPA